MKKFAITKLILFFVPYILCGQHVGINKTNPLSPLDISQPASSTLGPFVPVVNINYGGNNADNVIGIRSKSKPADTYGIGGYFEGGQIGLESTASGFGNASSFFIGLKSGASGNGNGYYYGMQSRVNNTGGGESYGLYARCEGGAQKSYGVWGEATGAVHTNIGVFGNAMGGEKNWAGYFANGAVYVNGRLSIGNESPQHSLEIMDAQAVANMVTSSSANGSVLVLQNNASNPNFLGAVNFNNTSSTPGQIVYHADHNLSIRVNNSERLRINPNGMLGVGRNPLTNRLEVEGNASKSSAGDWLANSDERLKKNIHALDPRVTAEKLLSLRGISYEWNDDKTGTIRPEGIQYGFTAQNIKSVFPELVEEDAHGYLQTSYSTYDAMIIETLRFLYEENRELRAMVEELVADKK